MRLQEVRHIELYLCCLQIDIVWSVINEIRQLSKLPLNLYYMSHAINKMADSLRDLSSILYAKIVAIDYVGLQYLRHTDSNSEQKPH